MNRVVKILAVSSLLLYVSAAHGADPWQDPLENVYFGDLHVHTNISIDAFITFNAPGNYVEEAGLYATHCAKLDFYSVTDHAEHLISGAYWDNSQRWAQFINDYAAAHPDPDGDPMIVAFTGWEWTQTTPWGHKNVIMKYDDAARVTPSPIRCYKGELGFRPQDLNDRNDLTFLAETPQRLFELVREYCTEAGTGCEAVVIPHGNSWGQFTMHTDWDIQINRAGHDPELQRLIEVYSQHGNSEEYRNFGPDYMYYLDDVEVSESECNDRLETGRTPCKKVCQEPSESYEPCCYRAGEIARERCLDPDSEWCKERIDEARQTIAPLKNVPLKDRGQLKPEYRHHPNKVEDREWRLCDQCIDCYQPAFNYNPNGSVQYALAKGHFDDQGEPLYYRFGFLASTDNHSARAGSVMEEKDSGELSVGLGATLYKLSRATGITAGGMGGSVPAYGLERMSNYLNPGGLVAVLAPHRTRDDLWQGITDRHVYGTSGARIELWVRAQIKEQGADKVVSMGDVVASSEAPLFHLKAKGAFREDGTCSYDEHPEIQQALSRSEFERVCMNQCYSPGDERVPIARVEVVKIRQPLTLEESEMADKKWSPSNPDGLIMDPYAVFEFSDPQIEWSWSDDQFAGEASGRSLVYYFRVIQAPTPGYSCNPAARLGQAQTCVDSDPDPETVSKKANPQDGATPTARDRLDDLCYSDPGDEDTYCQHRAWSSPVYVVKE